MKILPFTDASPRQLTSLTALLDATFGVHREQAAIFTRWREDPGLWALLACAGERCVGAMVTSEREVADFDTQAFGVSLPHDPHERIVLFQMAVTDPHWRRAGVATTLATHHLARAQAHGIALGAGISWEHGAPGNSARMFEAAGFEVLARAPTFYREMHAQTGQTCPHCRPAPCACSAALYVTRDLHPK